MGRLGRITTLSRCVGDRAGGFCTPRLVRVMAYEVCPGVVENLLEAGADTT